MPGPYVRHDDHISHALEISIHVGLLILLATACFFILRPFLPLIIWGIILAIAVYPAHRRVRNLLHGHGGYAAVICTLVMFAVLIVPVVLLTGSLVDGAQNLGARLKEGTVIIPPPPSRISEWPVVGVPLADAWQLASKNLSAALQPFVPQIRALIPELLLASAGVGLAVLQWIFSILIAGALLANSASGAKIASALATRVFGDKGPEFEQLAGATIRSVSAGIIGVALIQSLFAAIGFLVSGIPGAGLWAVIFLFAAVLQLGGLVLIPAVIYMFAIASTTKALIFMAWCIVVGVMDNLLKPLLLGRGVAVPMAVVFLGAIGGFVAMGAIGLFVGAIVLSVAYKLVIAWLEQTGEPAPQIWKQKASA